MAHLSRQVYLNSDDAIRIGTFYYWPFRDTMICPEGSQFQIGVVDTQIPFSMYAIDEERNKFRLDGTEYSIEPGNYNVIQLLREIRELTNCSTNYDSIHNKCTLTFNSQVTLEYSQHTGHQLLKMLGFTNSTIVGTTFTSDSVVNILGITAVYLRCGNMLTYNMDSRNGGFSSVLAKIPVNASGNGVISYENTFQHKTTIWETYISGFMLGLEDRDGHEISLNGQPWQITLQVEAIPLG